MVKYWKKSMLLNIISLCLNLHPNMDVALGFQKFTPICQMFLDGKDEENYTILTIKGCIDEDSRTSFHNMKWLNQKNLKSIFYDVPTELIEIIIILNGLDEKFMNTDLLEKANYPMHRAILNNNVARLKILLEKYKIKPLSSDCMALKSVEGCYSQVQKRLGLPTLKKIKTRMFFRLKVR